MAQNQMQCEGCGQKFTNQSDMERHQKQCPAFQARSGSKPMTQGAGGGTRQNS